MRRVAVLLSIGAVVLIGLFAAGRTINTTAQEGTPAVASPIAIPAHPVFAVVAPEALPGQLLALIREVVPPGAEGEFPTHSHPGAFITLVESGRYGVTLHQGRAFITRAGAVPAALATPDPAATPGLVPPSPGEPIPVGTEVVAEAGDWIFSDGGAVITERNAGDEPVVVLFAATSPVDLPPIVFTNEEGTPVPGTPTP